LFTSSDVTLHLFRILREWIDSRSRGASGVGLARCASECEESGL